MPDFGHFDALRRFRENLVLDSGRTYAQAQAPFQVQRFEAWDYGRRVYCETCTGASKTTDVAAWVLSWCALTAGWEAAIYAADADQARKVLQTASGFLRRDPSLRTRFGLDVQRAKIVCERSGSSCVVDSSDLASAEGLIADCVILEQLESWKHEELWESVYSRAHKRQCKILVIANAFQGEDDWGWKVRDLASSSADWQFLRVDALSVPWITAEMLDDEKRVLREATFQRLYFNRTGNADTSLFTPAQVEAMLRLAGPAAKPPEDVRRCVVSLDLGLKRDLAVLTCLGERMDGLQVLLNMQAWQGSEDSPVRIEGVEATVKEWIKAYAPQTFLYDPWQFERSAQGFAAERIRAEPFTFSTKSVNDLSNQLWRRGIDGKLWIYPGAGPSLRGAEPWDLAREFKSAKMVEDKLGYRIETKGHGTKDRIISLGMASLWLQQNVASVPRIRFLG